MVKSNFFGTGKLHNLTIDAFQYTETVQTKLDRHTLIHDHQICMT